jgi:hypothetical protein
MSDLTLPDPGRTVRVGLAHRVVLLDGIEPETPPAKNRRPYSGGHRTRNRNVKPKKATAT